MSFVIIGPFFGVLSAFALERAYSWYRDRQNRKKLNEILKIELERCMKLLTGKGNLLPTKMWESIVTSGDVKVLPFNERTQLFTIYFEIENHNYEAKRVRDSAVVALTGSHRVILAGRDQAESYWRSLSKNLIEEEKNLVKKGRL